MFLPLSGEINFTHIVNEDKKLQHKNVLFSMANNHIINFDNKLFKYG